MPARFCFMMKIMSVEPELSPEVPPDPTPKRVRRKRYAPGKRPRSTPQGGHVPVMLREVLEFMDPMEGGIYVDTTLGLAGHGSAILTKAGPEGLLVGMDFDPNAILKATETLTATGNPFRIFQGNFAGIELSLAQAGVDGCDGLLADLGMSSYQVDDAERGFSYRRDGPLDMRMDPTRGKTAAELLATISEKDLVEALANIGDEPDPWTVTRRIIAAREKEPIVRTGQLATLLEPQDREWKLRKAKDKFKSHPAIRVFQTLRILVNRELANLEHLLRILPWVLKPQGVAVILSFHSGEDRLVKKAFRAGLETGIFEAVSDRPIRPTFQEKLRNPRSRSTRLRWARRAKS